MEKLDLFQPQGRSRALLMFIHGGYWRALDKKDHSFVAAELVKHGVTVAVPNYALCPSVTIEEIVRQMLQASAWLWRNGGNFGAPYNRVHVAGHSAGGHLTAMMLAALWPSVARDLPKKVVSGGLAISGVYDLRDIVNVPSVNDDVRMTAAQAWKWSPMSLPPATDAPLYLAAGEKELPPFVDQNRAFGQHWKKVLAQDIPCPDDNHFSILEKLARSVERAVPRCDEDDGALASREPFRRPPRLPEATLRMPVPVKVILGLMAAWGVVYSFIALSGDYALVPRAGQRPRGGVRARSVRHPPPRAERAR